MFDEDSFSTLFLIPASLISEYEGIALFLPSSKFSCDVTKLPSPAMPWDARVFLSESVKEVNLTGCSTATVEKPLSATFSLLFVVGEATSSFSLWSSSSSFLFSFQACSSRSFKSTAPTSSGLLFKS